MISKQFQMGFFAVPDCIWKWMIQTFCSFNGPKQVRIIYLDLSMIWTWETINIVMGCGGY